MPRKVITSIAVSIVAWCACSSGAAHASTAAQPGQTKYFHFHSGQGMCRLTGVVDRTIVIPAGADALYLDFKIVKNARSGRYKLRVRCSGEDTVTRTLQVNGSRTGTKKIASHVFVKAGADPVPVPVGK